MNTTKTYTNPFECDAALNLPEEALVKWYIEDKNYARILRTTKNVLINGHRGSGKSMMLIYNSLHFQKLREILNGEEFPPKVVGIYVPCNSPLTHRQDHELMPVEQQVMLSEFYFVMAIVEAVADTFEKTPINFSDADYQLLADEMRSVLPNLEISNPETTFTCLRRHIQRQLTELQRALQRGLGAEVEYDAVSFYSLVSPILSGLKRTSIFEDAHFSILIDDAHDLNPQQKKLLNSWLSFRDHSVFSFKVAIAGLRGYDLRTLSRGTILEGHDYHVLDLEQPFQSDDSEYAGFASRVISERLKGLGLTEISADQFFPSSADFESDIAVANESVRMAFLQEKGWDKLTDLSPEQKKTVSGHVYKYGRVKYFRERKAKANLPTYAGFETLVHLSTGVIRNLLNPCYKMFDTAMSRSLDVPQIIAPKIQSDIVKTKSDDAWEQIRRGLENVVEGCTKEDSTHLGNLFAVLGDYFLDRLLHHKSEPRLLSFIVSDRDEENMKFLEKLFCIAQEAQLLYIRNGSGKTRGRREDFYTPNRILWPVLGLDVCGYHGRASIPSGDLVAAARNKTPIKINDSGGASSQQMELI